MITVQVLVKPEWCPDGQMYVINADEISLRFNPVPVLEEEGPTKIILVHDEIDAFRLRESIAEMDDMELYESGDGD